MERSYASDYQRLFESHWWWQARSSYVERRLHRLSPPAGFGRILDVGCGNGLFFPVLRRHGEPEGVEPDAELLTGEGVSRGTIHNVPFDRDFRPGHLYGLILMLDVLEHLPDAVAALEHAVELLAADGQIVITVPAFCALWTSHDDRNHHFTRYTRSSLRRVARAAGLKVVRSEYLFGWLAPVKLAVRLIEATTGPSAALHRIPPPAFNRLLYALCRTEQLSWGRALPFGSSLYARLVPERRSAGTSPSGGGGMR